MKIFSYVYCNIAFILIGEGRGKDGDKNHLFFMHPELYNFPGDFFCCVHPREFLGGGGHAASMLFVSKQFPGFVQKNGWGEVCFFNHRASAIPRINVGIMPLMVAGRVRQRY